MWWSALSYRSYIFSFSSSLCNNWGYHDRIVLLCDLFQRLVRLLNILVYVQLCQVILKQFLNIVGALYDTQNIYSRSL